MKSIIHYSNNYIVSLLWHELCQVLYRDITFNNKTQWFPVWHVRSLKSSSFSQQEKTWTNWRLVIFLRSIRKLEVTVDKLQPWKLVMGIEIHSKSPEGRSPQLKSVQVRTLNLSLMHPRSLRTSLRIENPWRPNLRASPHFQEYYPLPHSNLECKIKFQCLPLGKSEPYCEIYSELSLFYLTRPTLGKTILAEPKKVLPKVDEPQWRKYSILVPSSFDGRGRKYLTQAH